MARSKGTTAVKGAKGKGKQPKGESVDAGSPKEQPISWAKRPDLTWRFVQWLKDFPSERVKLFSDSTSDAKKEDRRKKVAKDSKAAQHDKIAKFIFENDDEYSESYARNSARFAKSTGQHLQRIKASYRDHCKTLGETGSGIRPEDVVVGSELHNSIELIKESFPWWEDLHAFWRELPSYNPCGVSTSEPGHNHAAAAAAIYQADGSQESSDEDAEADEVSALDENGLTPEARQELDDDPDADLDDDHVQALTKQPPLHRPAGATSRSSSISPPVEVQARRGEAQATRARSTSTAPDILGRAGQPKASAPAGTSAGSLKQRIANLPRASTAKGRKNLLEGFAEARLVENERLSKKRAYDHTETMARLTNEREAKRFKVESEERRMREARAHDAVENERARAHALEMKQLDLQIALAAVGQRPPAGPAIPPPAMPRLDGAAAPFSFEALNADAQFLHDPLNLGALHMPDPF